MAGKILLDTNVVIAHLDGDETINERIARAPEVYISVVVAGELFFGSAKSQRKKNNLSRLERFLRKITTLTCDVSTARIYGDIKNELRTIGKPIPDNDIWIAANVRQYGLTLSSRDEHFSYVPNLQVEKW
jgi:tRNA(fMet)-specific endonuclease VapC